MYKKDCESIIKIFQNIGKLKNEIRPTTEIKNRQKRIEKDTKNIWKNIVIRAENCRVI